jgi:hypothetical protein
VVLLSFGGSYKEFGSNFEQDILVGVPAVDLMYKVLSDIAECFRNGRLM